MATEKPGAAESGDGSGNINPLQNSLAGAVIVLVFGLLCSLFPRYESITLPWSLGPEILSVVCYVLAAVAAVGALEEAGMHKFFKGVILSSVAGSLALAIHAHTVGLRHSNSEVFLERCAVWALAFFAAACIIVYVPDLLRQPIQRSKMGQYASYIITLISVISAAITIYLFVFPHRA